MYRILISRSFQFCWCLILYVLLFPIQLISVDSRCRQPCSWATRVPVPARARRPARAARRRRVAAVAAARVAAAVVRPVLAVARGADVAAGSAVAHRPLLRPTTRRSLHQPMVSMSYLSWAFFQLIQLIQLMFNQNNFMISWFPFFQSFVFRLNTSVFHSIHLFVQWIIVSYFLTDHVWISGFLQCSMWVLSCRRRRWRSWRPSWWHRTLTRHPSRGGRLASARPTTATTEAAQRLTRSLLMVVRFYIQYYLHSHTILFDRYAYHEILEN